LAGPKRVGFRVMSGPKGLGFGSFRDWTQESWDWGPRPNPRGWGRVLGPCPDPRGLGGGFVFDPRGLGQCRDPRSFGFGSFRAWTKNGLGLGVRSGPKGVWVWVLPCPNLKWVRVGSDHVRTQ
jgi:hypothetical protein